MGMIMGSDNVGEERGAHLTCYAYVSFALKDMYESLREASVDFLQDSEERERRVGW